ncbi:methylmalonyl-CoA epimerase [Virgibacillus alimentarius]|uniref:Methylmalonyl-CoA mutase C-terminal domain/subunit n=1 Tax=Virgibacillus alimentarius TaxID=698769 RepID=A0ABS4S4X1_9BACI|nr:MULTISPECIES: methylmalonyl-CoA epimerase [Virgibacillus]MBP2256449.1 methylmalonyl-CoA mutase C-terminal domain/subunit [Virgibacillus alimentarius]HLR66394.1 methylmalonyl-CoA epimerase [Virgibacillus sp.]
MERKIRMLITELDSSRYHQKVLNISQELHNLGIEIICPGLPQSPVQVAQTSVQENVDIIGLFSFSGDHNTLFPKIIDTLKEGSAGDVPIIGGGKIPREDIPFLIGKGIKKVFTRTSATVLSQYIQDLLKSEEDPLPKPQNIAHIGIAVKELDHALSFYTESLGLELEKVENVESEGVKIAFLKIGDSRFELMEPFNKSSPIQRFIDNKGEGIHHIALAVSNVNKRLHQLKTEGIQLIDNEPKCGADQSQIAFIHPHSTNGVLFELCQQVEAEHKYN